MKLKKEITDMIASFTVLRHGNAEEAVDGQSDVSRRLTDLGINQAVRLGELLSLKQKDVVVSSPAVRALTTIVLATGQLTAKLDVLGISEDPNNPLNQMFKDLSYSPLTSWDITVGYFNHTLGICLQVWAQNTLDCILATVEQFYDNQPLNVVVGCHAIMSSALIWAIYERFQMEAPPCVLHEILGEAQALRLTIERDGNLEVEHIVPNVS